jgi:hypothetical protein
MNESMKEQLARLANSGGLKTSGQSEQLAQESQRFAIQKPHSPRHEHIPVTTMTGAPCKDMFSDFLFLYFSTEAEAKIYSDQLWDTASISSSPIRCNKCSKFHLVDINGLRLVSDEEKTYKYDSSTRKRIPLKRCQSCLSSNGIPKAIFSDIEEAQLDLEHLGFEVKHPMYAYKCPHGMGIHLTKQEPTGARSYLGLVLQKKFAKSLREKEKPIKNAVEKRTEDHARNIKSEPITDQAEIDKKSESSSSGKFKCLSCGWRNNYETTLKCAWCQELGPYEKV